MARISIDMLARNLVRGAVALAARYVRSPVLRSRRLRLLTEPRAQRWRLSSEHLRGWAIVGGRRLAGGRRLSVSSGNNPQSRPALSFEIYRAARCERRLHGLTSNTRKAREFGK